jgi:ferredoxin
MPSKQPSIFDLMNEESESKVDEKTEKKKLRQELLAPTGVEDLFKEGKISINKFTCVGGQCKLCIKACPTNALYWSTGGVGITEVVRLLWRLRARTVVDDCARSSANAKTAQWKFSKPSDIVNLPKGSTVKNVSNG